MPPEPSTPDGPPSRFQGELLRGALVNTIGLGAKLVQPLFIVAVTWLFGPAVMAVFFLGIFILDLVIGAAVWGFVDAVTVLGSRHADHDPAKLYETVGASLRVATITAVGAAITLELSAAPLVDVFYPDYPELVGALRLLAIAIPLMTWTQLAIGGTKVGMRMEYDAAVLGFFNPMARLVLSVLAWWLGGGLMGFMIAIVCAEAVTLGFAVWGFARHFDVRATVRAAWRGAHAPGLFRFAIPQSLNVTFSRYLTRIDVLMLGAFGFGKAQLAFYATAALITSNLRQVRLVFSSSLAPVAARHHQAGERSELQAVLNQLSRWTLTLIIPIVLTLVVFRADILRIVDEAYVGDSTFMVVLLLAPLIGCGLGLFGNTIIYTGHTSWTLANSFIVAALNTAFNFFLIPRWGLMGAAAGTAAAALLIAILQVIEIRFLEGLRVRWRALWRPVVGLAASVAVLWPIWDPAHLSVWLRVASGIALPAGFVLLMAAIGHAEVRSALARVVSRRGASAHG